MADVNCDERRDFRPLHMVLMHEYMLKSYPDGLLMANLHDVMSHVWMSDPRLQGQTMMNHSTMALMLKTHGLVDVQRRPDQAHYRSAFLKEDLLVPVQSDAVRTLDESEDEAIKLEHRVEWLEAELRERDEMLRVAEGVVRMLTAVNQQAARDEVEIESVRLWSMVDTLRGAESLDYASVYSSGLLLEYVGDHRVRLTIGEAAD